MYFEIGRNSRKKHEKYYKIYVFSENILTNREFEFINIFVIYSRREGERAAHRK